MTLEDEKPTSSEKQVAGGSEDKVGHKESKDAVAESASDPMDIENNGEGQGEESKEEDITESSSKCMKKSNEDQERLLLADSKPESLTVEHPFARPLKNQSALVLQFIGQGKNDKLTSDTVRHFLLLILIFNVTALILS
jgi:hypothetical protein